MEEVPNLNLNQLPEEPEKDEDLKRDTFTESWRKFRSRFTDFSLENIRHSDSGELQSAKQERDKDDNDDDIIIDDDDSEDENNVVKKAIKKRKRNKRSIVNRDIDEPVAQDNRNDLTVGLELKDHTEPENRDIDIVDTNTDIEQKNNEQLIGQVDIDPEETTYSEQLQQPVNDDIFSIREVINKKRINTPYVQPNNIGSGDQNINNYYVHEEVVQRRRNGGLIALDILNYGLALRRDNKNKRLSDKKIQKLSNEVKKKFGIIKQNNSVEQPKNELKINHKPVAQNEVIVQQAINYNLNNDSLLGSNAHQHVVEERIETIKYVPEQVITESTIQKKMPVQSSPELAVERPSNFEAIERRIENLDRQSVNKIQKENNKKNSYLPNNNADYFKSDEIDVKPVVRLNPPNHTSISENKDYKNIIMPGIWGAITGIVVFVILYMLTIR